MCGSWRRLLVRAWGHRFRGYHCPPTFESQRWTLALVHMAAGQQLLSVSNIW